jgi:hypothetical protein
MTQTQLGALHQHFVTHFGHPRPRVTTLNWAVLGLQRHDLAHLDSNISDEKIIAAVKQLPSEKSPGPDGFIGAFFKQCWDIIGHDVKATLRDLFALKDKCWILLNSANITLLSKKDGAQEIGDYRPISVMHNVVKLLGKILANQLAPLLDILVSHSQSAFIKGRSIQDNFQYVQGAVCHFHQAKTPMLFLKLDIAKAFDSVRWEYLIELMQALGFGQSWRDLLAILWQTTSSRIILNGAVGHPIQHGHGLWQGDPLSPMIFILTMDPLQRLLDMATQAGLLSP